VVGRALGIMGGQRKRVIREGGFRVQKGFRGGVERGEGDGFAGRDRGRREGDNKRRSELRMTTTASRLSCL